MVENPVVSFALGLVIGYLVGAFTIWAIQSRWKIVKMPRMTWRECLGCHEDFVVMREGQVTCGSRCGGEDVRA